jgi:hypothetical protein
LCIFRAPLIIDGETGTVRLRAGYLAVVMLVSRCHADHQRPAEL